MPLPFPLELPFSWRRAVVRYARADSSTAGSTRRGLAWCEGPAAVATTGAEWIWESCDHCWRGNEDDSRDPPSGYADLSPCIVVRTCVYLYSTPMCISSDLRFPQCLIEPRSFLRFDAFVLANHIRFGGTSSFPVLGRCSFMVWSSIRAGMLP